MKKLDVLFKLFIQEVNFEKSVTDCQLFIIVAQQIFQKLQAIKSQDYNIILIHQYQGMKHISSWFNKIRFTYKEISRFLPVIIISAIMLILVLGIWSHYDLKKPLYKLQNELQKGPLPDNQTLQFSQILESLYNTPFTGQWEASIKKSSTFKNSKGKIYLMGTKDDEKYNLKIRIFDGFFRNSYYYDIEIKSQSIITEQKFIKNSILIETQAPMIGFLTQSEMIQTQFSQAVYISSFKLKIDYTHDKCLIQFMFSAPNSFNFFAKKLQQQSNTIEKIIYALILSVIAIFQMYGALSLKKKIIEEQNIGISKPRIAFSFILIGTLWDLSCGFLPIYYQARQNIENFMIFSIPLLLWSCLIFFAEFQLLKQTIRYYFLKKINQDDGIIFQNKAELQARQIQNENEQQQSERQIVSITLKKRRLQSQQNINLNQSSLKISQQVQQKFQLSGQQKVNKNFQKLDYKFIYGSQLLCHILIILSLILGLLIVYITNLKPFVLILSSFTLLAPQIIWNYHYGMMECKPNQLCSKPQELAIFLYAIPRVAILIYCRSYTENIFNFEKDLILCLFCMIGIILQITVRTIQIIHGGRSIMLKFIQKPQFTYFLKKKSQLSQQCTICMYSLHQLSGLQINDVKLQKLLKYNQYVHYENQNKPLKNKGDITNITSEQFEAGINGLIALNKITVTPCNHKFHSKCLAKWTDNKLQCPNCRSSLQPVQAF